MFLLVSVCHVGAHPGGHQHGVSIQISINLGKIFLRISCIRNILQKNNLQLARAAFFFVYFLAVVVAMWNFRVKHFMEKMSHALTKNICCLCSCSPFFFHRCSFSPCWPLAFLIFSPSLYNFSVFLPKIFVSFVFSLVVALCRSFSRWASLACRLLSRFLCHSLSLHSKFVIMTINIKVMLHETIRNDDF